MGFYAVFDIFAFFFFFFFFSTYLPSPPPVRATVGEVRYSIEIDVGGGKGQYYKPGF